MITSLTLKVSWFWVVKQEFFPNRGNHASVLSAFSLALLTKSVKAGSLSIPKGSEAGETFFAAYR